ncbi:MAG: hypothetical protein NTW19_01830 [Planctomycetota bacterium]|nr:hypothetical protein [Planctomycetota bacterium]
MRPTLSGMILTLATAIALASQTLAQTQSPPPPPPAPAAETPAAANPPATVNITTPGPAQVTVQVTTPPPVPQPARPVAHAKPNPQPISDEPIGPNLQGFAAAYQASGDPRILVLVGIDSRPAAATVANLRLGAAAANAANGNHAAAGQQTDQAVNSFEKGLAPTGQVATGKGLDGAFIGKDLTLFDPSGDALILRSTIEEWLHRVRDVDVVSLDALAERDRRELALLGMRDEKQAMDILSQKLNADVVLVVRMLNNGYVRDRGAMWRVSVEALQVGRGRKIGGFAFEWTEGVDAYTIKRYAQEITRKFMDQYIGFYTPGPVGPAQRYSVRLLGLGDAADVVRARQAFAKIPGMERVTGGEFTASGNTSVSTLALMYAGGPLELMVELQNAANKELGMTLSGTDAGTGTITLIAGPGTGKKSAAAPAPTSAAPVPAAPTAETPARAAATDAPATPATPAAPASAAPIASAEKPRWQLFVDASDQRAKPLRDAFLAEYKAQGSPKIAVVVARALSDSEKLEPVAAKQIKDFLDKHPAGAPAPGVFVTLGLAGVPTTQISASGYGLFDNARVERAVAKQLAGIGVTVPNPGEMRGQLAKDGGKEHDLFDADDLVLLAGKAAGADIVIQGIGRPTPGSPGAADYTFRAVRVADGAALAAEGWFTEPMPVVADDLAGYPEQSFQNIAGYAAGKMADQMLASWSAPRTLTVSVLNAKAQKDVFTLMSAIKSNVPIVEAVDFVKHEAGGAANGGTGSFTLRYRGSYDNLMKLLAEQEKTLPVTVVKDKSTADAVTVRIKETL